jgi:hypothetical protein
MSPLRLGIGAQRKLKTDYFYILSANFRMLSKGVAFLQPQVQLFA